LLLVSENNILTELIFDQYFLFANAFCVFNREVM
jgi:hypothetical protein